MRTKSSDSYLSNREWLAAAIEHEDVILRGVSALEYLQLFNGYFDESNIDVYAKKQGIYSNINYHVVNSFDGIDFFRHGNVVCSTISQAISDLIADPNSDTQAIVEALSRYYYSHDESFSGLNINCNNPHFEELKSWAQNYYNDGAYYE